MLLSRFSAHELIHSKLHRVCEMEALHPSFSKPAKPFPNTPASTSVLRDSETSRMGDSECIISYD